MPRCAEWARASDIRPAGTAGSHAGYVLVEWPLPWPRDVAQTAGFEPLVEALRGTGLRLQTVYGHIAGDQLRRVIVYRHQRDEDGWVGRAVGVERLVHRATVLDEAVELVTTADGELTTKNDVLICGHGRRDVCCGSKGTQLLGRLSVDDRLGPNVRVWRTSHLGGHRFAPTALVLPDATSWAFLDDVSLAGIIDRSADPPKLSERYRGCSALPDPEAQAVEGAVLREVGWVLFDSDRRITRLEPHRLRYDVRTPDGKSASWEAVLAEGRRMAIPECGEPADAAVDHAIEVLVARLVRLN